MKYPINAEKFIAALRLEFGAVSKYQEESYREAVQMVNMCYKDGLQGESGYPLDLCKELREFAEAARGDLGELERNPFIPPLVTWCNMAYFQGQNDAKEATA